MYFPSKVSCEVFQGLLYGFLWRSKSLKHLPSTANLSGSDSHVRCSWQFSGTSSFKSFRAYLSNQRGALGKRHHFSIKGPLAPGSFLLPELSFCDRWFSLHAHLSSPCPQTPPCVFTSRNVVPATAFAGMIRKVALAPLHRCCWSCFSHFFVCFSDFTFSVILK